MLDDYVGFVPGNTYEPEYQTEATDFYLASRYEDLENEFHELDQAEMVKGADSFTYSGMLDKAEAAIEEGKYEQAITFYSELLESGKMEGHIEACPSEFFLYVLCRYEVFNNLGICYAMVGDNKEALRCLTKALVYESITVNQDTLVIRDIDEFDKRYAKSLTSWNNIKLIMPFRLKKENPFQYIVGNEHAYILAAYLRDHAKEVSFYFMAHVMRIIVAIQADMYNSYRTFKWDTSRFDYLFDVLDVLDYNRFHKKLEKLYNNKASLQSFLHKLCKTIQSFGVRGLATELENNIYEELLEQMLENDDPKTRKNADYWKAKDAYVSLLTLSLREMKGEEGQRYIADILNAYKNTTSLKLELEDKSVIDDVEKTIKLEKGRAEIVIDLSDKGIECKRRGQLLEALYYYSSALKLLPYNGMIYYNMGKTLILQEEYYRALKSFSLAYLYQANVFEHNMTKNIMEAFLGLCSKEFQQGLIKDQFSNAIAKHIIEYFKVEYEKRVAAL